MLMPSRIPIRACPDHRPRRILGRQPAVNLPRLRLECETPRRLDRATFYGWAIIVVALAMLATFGAAVWP